MLQKVDIICDFYEDVGRGYHFWPREIWAAQNMVPSLVKVIWLKRQNEERSALYML
jgi:phytoene/squalene synthetase